MPLTDRELKEIDEFLEQMKDFEPLTQEEVCAHYDIRLEDFPRWAIAQCERELEAIREMRRLFCDRTDAKSTELVREIDDRIAEVRRSISYWSDLAVNGPSSLDF